MHHVPTSDSCIYDRPTSAPKLELGARDQRDGYDLFPYFEDVFFSGVR